MKKVSILVPESSVIGLLQILRPAEKISMK